MRFKSLMIVLFSFVFAAGCGSAGWRDVAVNEDNGAIVRLQQKIKDGRVVPQHYQHPADISAPTLAWFLDELAYQPPPKLLGDSEPKPIFQSAEIDRLAPAVSRMLKKADASQRVQFTSFNYGGSLLFQKRRVTQGTLFVDAAGNLNVDFSWINAEVNLDDRPAKQGESYAQGDPIGFDKPITPVLASRPYIRHHTGSNGKTQPMWIEADLAELRRAAQSATAESDGTSEEPEPAAEVKRAKEPAAEVKRAKEPAAKAPAAAWETKKERIRSRLQFLKNLYEDGLISESEYQTEKQQVLKELQ